MNKPEYIVIHHSLTKDGIVADWKAIRRHHIEVKWSEHESPPIVRSWEICQHEL